MFDGVSTLTQVTAVDHWTTGNVTSMAFMFRGCTNLESISTMRANAATGAWDVSKVTTFESMFENCERLGDLTAFADWNVHGAVNLANMFKNAKGTTDLDVSGWDTTGASSRADMFTGLTSLNRLGVGNKTVLVGTGFDAIATRQPALGSWDRSDHSWFGNISDLTVLYPVGGNTITLEVNGVHNPLGTATYYEWAGDSIRGRFKNDNAYWTITWNNTEHTSANLYIGIYDVNGNREVDEDYLNTPWTKVLSSAGTRDGNDLITYVVMERGIKPVNFAHWFAGYKNLTDFDGRRGSDTYGVDVSGTTSLEGLFEGDTKLQIVGNISHWPVSHITSFANMFKGCESLYVVDIHNWQMGPVNAVNRTDMLSGCKSLKTLILNGTVSLRDSGLDDLAATDTRGPSHGSWLRIIDKTENTPYTADPWYGSSANLVKRYSDSTNTHGMGDGEGAIYIWTDVLRGRFEDNDNAWWHYDSSRKILTMGLDEPEAGETYTDADREVTALPSWLGITGVAALPWEVAFPNI